jgi:hypothetical protein
VFNRLLISFEREKKPMTTNQKAAVWGAFAADALSLGVHWVYNTVNEASLSRLAFENTG